MVQLGPLQAMRSTGADARAMLCTAPGVLCTAPGVLITTLTVGHPALPCPTQGPGWLRLEGAGAEGRVLASGAG